MDLVDIVYDMPERLFTGKIKADYRSTDFLEELPICAL